jgi:hypothetical protein
MRKNLKRNKAKPTIIKPGDKRRIRWILQHVDNKEAFLYALVESLLVLLEQKDTGEFKQTLDTWEASAEIDRIPGAKKRIWGVYEQFKTDKKISKDWKRFKKQIGIV